MDKGSIRHGNVETLPRFIRHLRDMRCCDGDSVTLECHVEALPEPAIIWEKDGRVLPSGKDDFVMSYDGIKAVLSIPRIYPEDEGEYTCVAKNSLGRTLSFACIIVDVPEEKENMLHRQLYRPNVLSTCSTPRSTPRSTPNRCFSPARLSYRNSIIDYSHVSELARANGPRCALSAPKFLAVPHNRVVEVGASVRFQCAIGGHPTPWTTWDKEGLIVLPNSRLSVKEQNDLRYLEINEVTFEDAGLYRVTLENDYGRIEATARLDVIKHSRYSKSPSARSIRSTSSRHNAYLHRRLMGPSTAIGGRMALASGFRGSSVPSAKFFHNGVEVEQNERVSIHTCDDQVLLLVDQITAQDNGVYMCVLQMPNGEILSSYTSFETSDAYIYSEPKIIKTLPELIEGIEGETLNLNIEVDCLSPYTYVWRRDGEVLIDGDDCSYIDHGNGLLTLRLHDVFDIDSGLYECEINTYDGLSCKCSGQLNIERQSAARNCDDRDSLVYLKNPLPVIVCQGSAASFCAKVYPFDATTEWYIAGRRITSDSEDITLESTEDGTRCLHLHKTHYTQSGEVQVSIKYPGKSHPAVRTYTSLVVLPNSSANKGSANRKLRPQPAFILQGPKDCTALIGASVRLHAVFEANPAASIKWLRGCHTLENSSHIIIETCENQSTILINDITADDSGKYTIQIMNELSTDVASASVAVEGPPEAPSGKPSTSSGKDRVAVAWCGPNYDGGSMITGFILEMQQVSVNTNDEHSTWLEVATIVDSLAYTVTNLQPNAQYRFRVRAENVHGRSEPSMASDYVQIMPTAQDESDAKVTQQPIYVKSGGDFRSRFEIIEELGKGRFGVVYKVQDKELPHQLLAAKVIKCIKSRDRQKILEEIDIMKSLQHPKLLQLAASFEAAREIVMVMEYITGGELFERVVADDFTLTEMDCILFLRQVCEGCAYMHSQNIVHLDLKPENIMCNTRNSHQIKIIDFGLAQRLKHNTPVRVLFGTPEFIPPEIINYEPIGLQSDMWSVGVICYVLLSGLSPFGCDSDVETFSNITRADYDFDDEAFDCVSEEAKEFISNLLVHRKEDRWSAEECLRSEWLRERQDENLSNNKICTDKLKKFIIRRKWQKTGNAIRALGRMSTLSASRRNSAISAAAAAHTGCSPRSCTSAAAMSSGLSLNYSASTSPKMGSLHEEDDDDFNQNLTEVEISQRMPSKEVTIRCDSGYSDCSNCSASHEHSRAKSDTSDMQDCMEAMAIDTLKSKLNEISAETMAICKELPEIFQESAKPLDLQQHNQNELYAKVQNEESAILAMQMTALKNKEPIMRSDFTNTIEMRKKSLENSASKDAGKTTSHSPKTLAHYETSQGRVSQMKSKFNQDKANLSGNVRPKACLNMPNKSANKLSACSSAKTTPAKQLEQPISKTFTQTGSLPSSPVSARRSPSPIRLSGRVKEATERLAQKQTVSSAARYHSPHRTVAPAVASAPSSPSPSLFSATIRLH